MKRKISVLIIVFAVSLLTFSGCGDKAVSVTNHERPVFNLCASLSHNDGSAYLNCFAPVVKKTYLAAKDSPGVNGIVNKVRENSKLEPGDNITCEVIGKTELTDEKKSSLQKQYKKNYSKNDTIDKAFQLSVTFNGPKNSVVKKLTVVLINESWYIYGDVIEGFDF